MIRESTNADVILDRLVHRSITIELHGELTRQEHYKLNYRTNSDQSKA
jgi:hypothetical protein